MSVFNGLLRAFGFGGGHDDEDNLEVGFDADEESATEMIAGSRAISPVMPYQKKIMAKRMRLQFRKPQMI